MTDGAIESKVTHTNKSRRAMVLGAGISGLGLALAARDAGYLPLQTENREDLAERIGRSMRPCRIWLRSRFPLQSISTLHCQRRVPDDAICRLLRRLDDLDLSIYGPSIGKTGWGNSVHVEGDNAFALQLSGDWTATSHSHLAVFDGFLLIGFRKGDKYTSFIARGQGVESLRSDLYRLCEELPAAT